jgi:hypothetical protein
MSSSLLAIRASSEAGSAEQKRAAERKRNLLVLINAFLIEHGYIEVYYTTCINSNHHDVP